ncbi:T9SS type A sorting domain-containing protein, partial [candidate division KSB1 bacterium]|nr:T9SS type A sorting domain-containing protein [candidate division KSB1 bacterium]
GNQGWVYTPDDPSGGGERTDDPATLGEDDKTNIVPSAISFVPEIDAWPHQVDVTDSIRVRVRVPLAIKDWDLWIYHADGQVDTLFAKTEISGRTLVPGIWYDIQQKFVPQIMRTAQPEEQVAFEIRARHASGYFGSARSLVQITSSNYLILDRNVFRPEWEGMMEIRFKLGYQRRAVLDIYDVSGRHILKLTDDEYQGGWNTYNWDGMAADGKRLGSGVYIVTLRSGEYKSWKKFMIVR